MDIDFTIIFTTLFNFILLGGIIFLVVIFFKSIINLKKQSASMDNKLNKVLELLEEDKNK